MSSEENSARQYSVSPLDSKKYPKDRKKMPKKGKKKTTSQNRCWCNTNKLGLFCARTTIAGPFGASATFAGQFGAGAMQPV